MEPSFVASYAALQRRHWWFRARQRVLQSVLARELPKGDLRIASVGCGPRENLDWLRAFGSPTGIDVETSLGAAGTVPFVVSSLDRLAIADASFDAVCALDVLEHLDDDVAGLREIARITKPGGLLLITVPAMPSLWGQQDRVSAHRRRYTRRSLVGALSRAGLAPRWTTYFNTLLFPVIAPVRWMRRLVPEKHDDRDEGDFADGPAFLSTPLTFTFSLERHLVGRVPLPVGVSLLTIVRV